MQLPEPPVARVGLANLGWLPARDVLEVQVTSWPGVQHSSGYVARAFKQYQCPATGALEKLAQFREIIASLLFSADEQRLVLAVILPSVLVNFLRVRDNLLALKDGLGDREV